MSALCLRPLQHCYSRMWAYLGTSPGITLSTLGVLIGHRIQCVHRLAQVLVKVPAIPLRSLPRFLTWLSMQMKREQGNIDFSK